MEIKELQTILALHLKWRRGESGGARANLVDANLAGAKISEGQEAALLAALRIVVIKTAETGKD